MNSSVILTIAVIFILGYGISMLYARSVRKQMSENVTGQACFSSDERNEDPNKGKNWVFSPVDIPSSFINQRDADYGVLLETITPKRFSLIFKGLLCLIFAGLWAWKKYPKVQTENWHDLAASAVIFLVVLAYGVYFIIQNFNKVFFYKKGLVVKSAVNKQRHSYNEITEITNTKESPSYQTLEKQMMFKKIMSYSRWTFSIAEGYSIHLKSNRYSRLDKKMNHFRDNLILC